jgi:hypothetical protein
VSSGFFQRSELFHIFEFPYPLKMMKRCGILFILLVFAFQSKAQLNYQDIVLPVRLTRGFGISGNMGWNSLTGVGVSVQSYMNEHLGFDAGAGLSSVGYKFSGRLRYLFLEKNFTPFAGAGFIYGTGLPNQLLELEYDGTFITFILNQSPFIQIVGGFDFVASNGFFIMADLGYAILLNDNIELISGFPSPDMQTIMNMVYGSGIVLEVSIGYIFQKKKQNTRFQK